MRLVFKFFASYQYNQPSTFQNYLFIKMTTFTRNRKNLLGEHPPETVKKESRDLLKDTYYDRIETRPVYQRNIRWKPSAMNDFIETVMNNGLVPGLIMYQLSADERTENKSFEMVDGQHRLFTLKAFVDSTYNHLPHINTPFIVHWNYEYANEEGEIQYQKVFYKETPDVIEWCQKKQFTPCFLSDEEVDYFDNFGLNITIIRSKITLNQRREIFMSLQRGIPVRNSDLLKNKTQCKLVAFMTENSYEDKMNNVFLERCYKKPTAYWVHWASRCFLLYNRYHGTCYSEKLNTLPVSETFLYEDKEITKLIERNGCQLNPRDHSVIQDFDYVFNNFIEFLKKFEEGCKLNPTQIFALFYVLCDDTKNRDYILTHIPYLAKEGNAKGKKNLWESKDKKEPRREYFSNCLETFSSIEHPAAPYDESQPSKKLRNNVFDKCIDGLCLCCEDNTIDQHCFEVGHIVARVIGGQTSIDNLVPICFNCNRSMGIRNFHEYKKDAFPHTIKNIL